MIYLQNVGMNLSPVRCYFLTSLGHVFIPRCHRITVRMCAKSSAAMVLTVKRVSDGKELERPDAKQRIY